MKLRIIFIENEKTALFLSAKYGSSFKCKQKAETSKL